MYYFYIHLSSKDEKYYYGSTKDLNQRLHAHVSGEVHATKYRRPLKLVYYEAYEEMRLARLRERQVKESGSVRSALHKRFIPSSSEGPARPPVGKPGQ